MARGILVGLVALVLALFAAGKGPMAAERTVPLALTLSVQLEDAVARSVDAIRCGEPKQRKHRCHHVARSVTLTSDIRPQRRFLTPASAIAMPQPSAAERPRDGWLAPPDGAHLSLGFREIFAATRRMHS